MSGNWHPRTSKEGHQVEEEVVIHVVVPSLYKDSVVRLQGKVFRYVVDDDCALQRSTNLANILHKRVATLLAVLPVKSMRNATVRVKLV